LCLDENENNDKFSYNGNARYYVIEKGNAIILVNIRETLL